MDPKIKEALIRMDFMKRYEVLSERFDQARTPSDKRLVHVDRDEVMDMIRGLGYLPSFDPKEKFFKTGDERRGAYTFRMHIILRDGAVEFVWVVYDEERKQHLGAPWGRYAKQLLPPERRIKKPVFGTYEDLEDILKTAFEMYEDFVNTVTEVQPR